jgi:hypothetical protein
MQERDHVVSNRDEIPLWLLLHTQLRLAYASSFCFVPKPSIQFHCPHFDFTQLGFRQGALHLHSALHAPVSQHGLLPQCIGLKCQVAGDVQVDMWDCRRGMLGSWTGFPKLAYYVAFIVFVNVKGGCCHNLQPRSKCR